VQAGMLGVVLQAVKSALVAVDVYTSLSLHP
jgi:hypothetical protein